MTMRSPNRRSHPSPNPRRRVNYVAVFSSVFLEIWGSGWAKRPVRRALLLLEPACPEIPSKAMTELTVDQRDSRLLRLSAFHPSHMKMMARSYEELGPVMTVRFRCVPLHCDVPSCIHRKGTAIAMIACRFGSICCPVAEETAHLKEIRQSYLDPHNPVRFRRRSSVRSRRRGRAPVVGEPIGTHEGSIASRTCTRPRL